MASKLLPVSTTSKPAPALPGTAPAPEPQAPAAAKVPEFGGRKGLDPTRYGDWEKGRTLHRFLSRQGSAAVEQCGRFSDH